MLTSDHTNAIREILREHGRLAQDVVTLNDQSDLFEAGLTSHACASNRADQPPCAGIRGSPSHCRTSSS